jgi:hypothetical protein
VRDRKTIFWSFECFEKAKTGFQSPLTRKDLVMDNGKTSVTTVDPGNNEKLVSRTHAEEDEWKM